MSALVEAGDHRGQGRIYGMGASRGQYGPRDAGGGHRGGRRTRRASGRRGAARPSWAQVGRQKVADGRNFMQEVYVL